MKKLVYIILFIHSTTCITSCQNSNSSDLLNEIFDKAIKIYPDDSLDLYNRFMKDLPSNNLQEIQKKIKRLEDLTSDSTVEKYLKIKQELIPVMSSIINTDYLKKSQIQLFAALYSDYDHFSGESLFDNLITNDENYILVWGSMKKIVEEASKDTTCISCLIMLKKNIRTNVELAEMMPEFVIDAISNNPKGFLDMYLAKMGEDRKHLANHITYYDSPDKNLFSKFKEISLNANKRYQDAANELLQSVDN